MYTVKIDEERAKTERTAKERVVSPDVPTQLESIARWKRLVAERMRRGQLVLQMANRPSNCAGARHLGMSGPTVAWPVSYKRCERAG